MEKKMTATFASPGMGDVGLCITKNWDETWRECALRYARRWGLESEVGEAYDAEIELGESESVAAWSACKEWDVLNVIEGGIERTPRS